MKKRIAEIGCAALIAVFCLTAYAWQEAPGQVRPSRRRRVHPRPPSRKRPAQTKDDAAEDPTAKLPPTTDAKEIVRRATEVDHHNFERAQKYTCVQRQVVKVLDKQGSVKSTEIKTYDVNYYFGEFYPKLIQMDDKPLSEKEQKKEDEKLEKFLDKRRNESEEERQKRLEKEKKEREESRAFVRDVVNAYDFRMAGEDKVSGADTWVIEAIPRADFKPTQPTPTCSRRSKAGSGLKKRTTTG